jgi:transaldolase
MIGRLDDWMKVVVERDGLSVDPAALDWAGIAAFKRTYGIFKERGYRSRMLVAAYRHHLHWTELVGGDVSLTIPYAWQVRFNNSGIDPVAADGRTGRSGLLAELAASFPDFRRAYEPDGLTAGRVRHLWRHRPHPPRLHQGLSRLIAGAIRDIVLPNPDVRSL